MTAQKDPISDYAQRANAALISYFKAKIPVLLQQNRELCGILSLRGAFADSMNTSPENYINGGYLRRIGGIFTPEERLFILALGTTFERVRLGFAYFSLLKSNLRPLEARFLGQYQLRAGWLRAGVPQSVAQDVSEHESVCAKLAFLLYFDDPKLADIEETAAFHDSGEPVIGDFTPHDPISRADKTRIEALAIRLICASARARGNMFANKIQRAFDIYEGNAASYEDVRMKVRDCDLLEMCVEALHIVANAPDGHREEITANMQEFWDYVAARLATARGRHFFQSLQTARQGTTSHLHDMIAHAHQYMILQDPDPQAALANFRLKMQARLRDEAGIICARALDHQPG